MKPKLGENISREWSEERAAPQLWDALKLVKSDPSAGLGALKELAQSDSRLAMMYLGHIYSKGRYSIVQDPVLAEHWLRRSAEASIEGSYQLAYHLQRVGKTEASLAEFEKLADLKYSPALFAVAWRYYKGEIVEKDLEKALLYFSLAEKEGHLHAANWKSKILMKEYMAPKAWLQGLTIKAKLLIPFIKTAIDYPESDLLRT